LTRFAAADAEGPVIVEQHYEPGAGEGLTPQREEMNRRKVDSPRSAYRIGEKDVNILAKTLAAIAAGALLATSALAQSAASLVVPIENEPAPRLFVERPLPGPLASGVAYIPYRVENLRIMPVGGATARNVSPRVGHLHITVDDLPWQWADYGQSNTIILVNLPRGEHNVVIEVVDPEGHVHTAQTVTFKSPGK
jgi:Family of unknown function (DUF6130)